MRRDIEIVQKERPVNLLEFTMLTPLPDSEDHKKLYERGVWMDPDLNKYDLKTVTVEHPRMRRQGMAPNLLGRVELVLQRRARRADDAAEPRLRDQSGEDPARSAMNFEGVHPQQCGYFRRKVRTQRRPELPRVPAAIFYPTHMWQTVAKYARFGLYALKGVRMRYRVQADPGAKTYSDLAVTPVIDAEEKRSKCSP